MTFEGIISEGAAELGLILPSDAPRKMAEYYRFLERKNREMNLTAIKGDEDSARLHFLDSLALLRYAELSGKSVVDVGTGGGFPGVPLLIAAPSADMTLMDSTEKKVDFLRDAAETLDLRADCVCARAEEAARTELRESFDIAVSRAVARLDVLCELCLPLIKPGGLFIAMKAADSDEEITEAKNAVKLLGGEHAEIKEYRIPKTDMTHRAVLIRKASNTPEKYPRRYAQIKKSPL